MNFIDPVELRRFVENNPKLVNRKVSKRHPGLFVLKYNARVFYDALWNESDFLLETRGLVVDADYNVIVKPFTKVFNYMENGTTMDRDELCTYVKKINGFMGVATYRPDISDKLIYSTTGSLDSDFVDLVEKWIEPLSENIKRMGHPGRSYIFEICDPSDPHIIKEEPGAYLIGANLVVDNKVRRYTEAELDIFCGQMGGIGLGLKRPIWGTCVRFSDVVGLSKVCQHEGFMVYGSKAMKIKSPYYLTTKFLARCNSDKLLDRIADNKQSRKNIDEEYYPLLDAIVADIDGFKALDEQGRIEYVKAFLSK